MTINGVNVGNSSSSIVVTYGVSGTEYTLALVTCCSELPTVASGSWSRNTAEVASKQKW